MASASELVSNRGDANLSVGSNNAIPIITPPERSGFNAMQEVSNRMMLQNHANNVMLFQQKLRDRDELYNQLQKGQIVVGDIEPKDKPAWEEAKKQQTEAFYNMAQNGGIANKEAYRKYIEATTSLSETATHLQARKVGLDQYKKDIATEPIQAKKEELIKQRDKQLEKPSNAMIDPFQRSLDFDADKLLSIGQSGALVGSGVPQTVTTQSVRTKETPGKPTTTTTYQKTVPVKAGKGSQPITTSQTGATGNVPETTKIIYKDGLPYSVTNQYVDFNKIKQNYNDDYLDPKGVGTELQDQFYDKFTDPTIMNHEEIKPTYDYMVKKAEEYNRARGFVPQPDGSMTAEDIANGAADVKKLINAFNVPPNPQTGQRGINMSKPELASYFALAHMDNYATQSEQLLDKVGELELKRRDAFEKTRHNRAMETLGAEKNRITLEKWKAQKKDLTDADVQAHQKYVDLASAVNPATGQIDLGNLSESRTYIGGIVYNSKGHAQIGKVEPKTNASGQKVYDVNYIGNGGKRIKTRSDLPENERTQFDQFNKKYGGTFRDYLKAKSLLGDITIEIQGKNGVGTASSISEGENLENVKFGNKGKNPVYDDRGNEVLDEEQQ